MLEFIVLSGAAAVSAGMKQGGDAEPHPSSSFHVSGELALVSDYRRNGVTQSDGDPAIQGRFDIRHDSGWNIGAFAPDQPFARARASSSPSSPVAVTLRPFFTDVASRIDFAPWANKLSVSRLWS